MAQEQPKVNVPLIVQKVTKFLFSWPNAPFALQCRQYMHIARFHGVRGVLVAHFAPLTRGNPRINYDPFFVDIADFLQRYAHTGRITQKDVDLVHTYDLHNFFLVAVDLPVAGVMTTTLEQVPLYTDLKGRMLCNPQSPVYEVHSDADDELAQRKEMVELLLEAIGRDASMPLTHAEYVPLAQFIGCGGYCGGELRDRFGQRVCYAFSSIPALPLSSGPAGETGCST